MIKNIICHHSGGTDANPMQDSSNYTLAMCDADHKARFGMKSSLGYWVGYHYFIDKAGKVTQTRDDMEEGAHCVGFNNTNYDKAKHPENLSIGICLAGNFDATLPTEAQKKSLASLLNQKCRKYGITADKIVPHRAHANKTCYGRKLDDQWASVLAFAGIHSDPVPVKETWLDTFNRLMLMGGFVRIDGKWKFTK